MHGDDLFICLLPDGLYIAQIVQILRDETRAQPAVGT